MHIFRIKSSKWKFIFSQHNMQFLHPSLVIPAGISRKDNGSVVEVYEKKYLFYLLFWRRRSYKVYH